MIDATTGFFLDGFTQTGTVITAACIAFVLAMILVCRLDSTPKGELPKKSLALSVGVGVAAAFLFIDAVVEVFTAPYTASLIVALASFALAACLAWYALSLYRKVRFPKEASLVGIVYALIRLIVAFADYTGEVSVTDSVFDLITLCLILLFFVANAKLICGTGSDRTKINLYAYGFSAALFCACQYLPCIIALLTGNSGALHGGTVPDFAYIGLSVYITLTIHAYSAQKA